MTFFDYGSGRGGDVRRLRELGIDAHGWDPFFAPHVEIAEADVVALTYVINVIEDADERLQVLRRAFVLARRALVVGVRVEHGLGDAVLKNGSWTKAGTFQKFYTHAEFLGALAAALGVTPRSPGAGIAYVFKNDAAAEQFGKRVADASTASPVELLDAAFRDGREASLATLASSLGRLPRLDEWLDRVRLSCCDQAGAVECDESHAKERFGRGQIIAFLALLRLYGVAPPTFRSLPTCIKEELVTVWHGYYSALREAHSLAAAAGTPEALPATFARWMAGEHHILSPARRSAE